MHNVSYSPSVFPSHFIPPLSSSSLSIDPSLSTSLSLYLLSPSPSFHCSPYLSPTHYSISLHTCLLHLISLPPSISFSLFFSLSLSDTDTYKSLLFASNLHQQIIASLQLSFSWWYISLTMYVCNIAPEKNWPRASWIFNKRRCHYKGNTPFLCSKRSISCNRNNIFSLFSNVVC